MTEVKGSILASQDRCFLKTIERGYRMSTVDDRRVGLVRPVWGLSLALAAATAAILVTAPAGPVHASDPMGIYTLVEDVVVEEPVKPEEPKRIRILGISALAYRPMENGQPRGGAYSNPAQGYLYFECPEGEAEICRMEWADLQKAIGDERCASYGDRYLTDPKPNGRLRPPDELPGEPDTYPIGQGVTMTLHGMQDTCDAIRELAAAGAAPTATSGEASGSYLPNVAADSAGASDSSAAAEQQTTDADGEAEDPDGQGTGAEIAETDAAAPDAAQSDGGGTDPAGTPLLTVALLIALGGLGAATAVAWSRQKRA
jgi:hypothetical protein